MELPQGEQLGEREGENQGMGLGMLGLRKAAACVGGYMNVGFGTEVCAGDVNLGVNYIWMDLNHETGWNLQGSVGQKGLQTGSTAPQHLEVWDSEEAVKETEAVVGREGRQIQENIESRSTGEEVLRMECH